ncbi:RsmB/NOP family class I SAM-dependent RNA methyltransferase [Enterovirga sp.]|uniref:RsmB/NOP family class I SAM-dependent RNA methyltransferase n=1 Tax=Enterovirga sp. TaxID=2026350 RepID=UPI0026289A2D|nr:RsmB/NOP family class I SAM-dependent RNA methyltransferase [Enterovirga sp.]MDB5591689.1 fmu [Enterovirga sp.]
MKARRPRPHPTATPPAGPAGLAARREAAKLVAAILTRHATLDDVAATALRGDDHALSRAIAVTTFRRLGTIRTALEARLAKGLPTDADLASVLATGAAQILFLDVPDHAAVDLSVRLVQGHPRTQHLSGLVNAVLRRVARERDEILAAAPPLVDVPGWLAERWEASYGPDRLLAIAAAHRAGAALDLTCRENPAEWAEHVGGRVLPSGSVRVADRRPVHELPGFRDGAWWVQDAAAALPARLIAAQPGERVLDLCAAPGGKTAQLAAAGARVTALDRSAPRLERVRDNLIRLRLAAEIVCADALAYRAEPFDAVLLDAPCTATGTARRHPDVLWSKSPTDLRGLTELQRRLLDHAAELVRPGGRLVYCVCSLEPEEGERQVQSFLARHPAWERQPWTAADLGIDEAFVTSDGDLRTAPDLWPADPASPEQRGGLDGFFAALLRRRKDKAGAAPRQG